MRAHLSQAPDAAEQIRVVLVDGQQLTRAGLRYLVTSTGDIAVVGEAGTFEEAVAVVQREQPDLVLLDMDSLAGRGLHLISNLLDVSPASRVLGITSSGDKGMHRQAVRLGIMGIVQRCQPPRDLVRAIEKIKAGEVWLDRSLTASVLGEMSRRQVSGAINEESRAIESLTGREREVIAAVGEGLNNKGIAGRLFISEVTVRHHLTSIYSKLNVSSRLELIIFAYRHGLAQIPR